VVCRIPLGLASAIGPRFPAAPYKRGVPNLFFWEIMADSLATANSNVDLRAGHFAGLFTISSPHPIAERRPIDLNRAALQSEPPFSSVIYLIAPCAGYRARTP
jgi:hypothetical protein